MIPQISLQDGHGNMTKTRLDPRSWSLGGDDDDHDAGDAHDVCDDYDDDEHDENI